ncbi:MAG: thiamine biosynthesis lipoprotein [Limisphaerales bacterium]
MRLASLGLGLALVSALIGFVSPIALAATPQWFSQSEAIMGTRVHVELQHTDVARAEALIAAVMADMHRVDRVFSPYKPDSEISKVNQAAGQGWVAVSDEFFSLLVKSAQVSDLTQGAFDITYASVGRFYDYREGVAPDDEQVAQAVHAIDYHHVQLDREAKKVRFDHPAVYIDLGGIAKGHAVDRAIELLQRAGVTQASVSAGGDSRILGDRNGQPWTVGVKNPRNEDKMSVLLPLVDTAVSTSGDYERYFERDGVRYHHILDPATGRSATGAMSVTILGPDATLTDGLSTSVFVLGADKGLALINQMPGIDAIIIDANGNLLYSNDLSGLN